jgi:hypothetical protein
MKPISKLDARRSQHLRQEHRDVSVEEISRRKWYHRMDLGRGVVTPGFPWEALWNNTRKVRDAIDRFLKLVLDRPVNPREVQQRDHFGRADFLSFSSPRLRR